MDRLAKIIKGCRKNDRISQKLLYERYYSYALKISFRYLDTFDEARELTDDTFLGIFRTLNEFKCCDKRNLDSRLTGWIKTKMMDALIKNLKSTIDMYQPETIQVLSPIDQYMVPCGSLSLYSNIISAVRGLPCILRTMFNLHVIDGYPQTEIATMFGTSLQAIGVYIRVARRICIRTLLASGDDCW